MSCFIDVSGKSNFIFKSFEGDKKVVSTFEGGKHQFTLTIGRICRVFKNIIGNLLFF